MRTLILALSTVFICANAFTLIAAAKEEIGIDTHRLELALSNQTSLFNEELRSTFTSYETVSITFRIGTCDNAENSNNRIQFHICKAFTHAKDLVLGDAVGAGLCQLIKANAQECAALIERETFIVQLSQDEMNTSVLRNSGDDSFYIFGPKSTITTSNTLYFLRSLLLDLVRRDCAATNDQKCLALAQNFVHQPLANLEATNDSLVPPHWYLMPLEDHLDHIEDTERSSGGSAGGRGWRKLGGK